MSPATVTRLAVTAVKGTRLVTVESIELGAQGARGNRQFFVIDARGRLVNAKLLGGLQTIVASFDPASRELALEFPDGDRAAGVVDGGESVTARFFRGERTGQVVRGPWADALSEHLGQPLRLVEAGGSVDRGARGAVSLISTGSLARLAAEAGTEQVDARRFRMLIEIDGVGPHEEDAWVGRRVRVGQAVVSFEGHVGRCLITSRDPETGVVDLPTLDLLRDYRRDLDTTEPLPFGIYGRVLEAAVVRVGDPVSLED